MSKDMELVYYVFYGFAVFLAVGSVIAIKISDYFVAKKRKLDKKIPRKAGG